MTPPEPVALQFHCPRCGLINLLRDVPRQHERPRCADCAAELCPDPPPADALHYAGAAALEAGAAEIRERVEEIKRRR